MQSKGEEIFASEEILLAVETRLQSWKKLNISTRLWKKDPTLWKQKPEENIELSNRLGWLDLPYSMKDHINDLFSFADEIKGGYDHIVLLGMGGSSLAPEVFYKTFRNSNGFPDLTVLDSTHPISVRKILDYFNLGRTLFIVSSKSGGTTETMSFFYTFYNAVSKSDKDPGKHFVAITDNGSGLHRLASEKGFRKTFITSEEVGGRYSALTYFGLVPASLIGIDIKPLLERAFIMEKECGKNADPFLSEGFRLGALLGEFNLMNKDKVTFFVSPRISSFPSWIEQLIAESTGKEGKGIVPIAFEQAGNIDVYNDDRIFVYLRLKEDDNSQNDIIIEKLKDASFPVVIIHLDDLYDLGKEIYRWEIATAMAGSVMQINPFDQPNVQLAKTLANESMEEYKKSGKLPSERPKIIQNNISLVGNFSSSDLRNTFLEFVSQAAIGNYIAIMAFMPYSDAVEASIDKLKVALRDRFHVPVTSGYGPRFLHSTGQLHKGDGNRGLFLQFTSDPINDLDVFGKGYSFGTLIAAQAQGDLKALRNNGRKVISIHLSGDLKEQIDYFSSLLI
ncbi:MAG: hypothetical protein P4L27_13595 [Ignavibacteriaceae bacterium]|nr:hypothetical protein [Ignavibacteriaceae bacterium]